MSADIIARRAHASQERDTRSTWLERLVLAPGLFRILLAYVVFVNHTIGIRLGSTAVYLFFCLSGFWVYQMWHKEYLVTDRPYVNFVISRFWRLIPIYYVALVFCLFCLIVVEGKRVDFGGLSDFLSFNFMFSQISILGYANLPYALKLIFPVWSLDIELQFYLAAPLLIWVLTSTSMFSWQRVTLYLVTVVGFMVFLTVYFLEPQSGFLPMYLIFFLIGLHTAHHQWRPNPATAVALFVLGLLLVALCMAVPATRSLFLEGSFSGPLSDFNTDGCLVVAFLMAPYAMATVRKAPPANRRLAGFDRDLSNVTYEIYLIHWTLAGLILYFFGHWSHYKQLPIIVAAYVLVFPMSWVVYKFVDRPIDRLRVVFVKSRRLPRPL